MPTERAFYSAALDCKQDRSPEPVRKRCGVELAINVANDRDRPDPEPWLHFMSPARFWLPFDERAGPSAR